MIEINNISFSYDHNPIFKDISTEIKKGQIWCMIGPNGSGKTTLLQCILGLKFPQQGYIHVEKQNIKEITEKKRAQLMSYVPQEKGHTFPFNVLEMVLMGRSPYIPPFSSPSKDDRAIAYESLQQIGITRLNKRIFTELSGGERQLVILARALAQQTKVIIMDEPTASLDYHNELIFLEEIVKLVKNNKITVIMATHFPNHAYYFENNGVDTNIMMLSEESLIGIGKPKDVLKEDSIKNLYGVSSSIITYDHHKKYIIPIQAIRR